MLDENLSPKILDFGFSAQMPKCVGNTTLLSAMHGLPGTNGYRPPEYADCKYSTKSDVYSFGIVSLYAEVWQLTCTVMKYATGGSWNLHRVASIFW